eukprot:15011435-Ditylum_brightwellii.AAC.1
MAGRVNSTFASCHLALSEHRGITLAMGKGSVSYFKRRQRRNLCGGNNLCGDNEGNLHKEP